MKNTKISLEEKINQQVEYQIREIAKKSVKNYGGLILAVGLLAVLGGSIAITFNYFEYGWIVITALMLGGSYLMTYLQLDYYFVRIDKAAQKISETIDKATLRKQIINNEIAELSKEVEDDEIALLEKKSLLNEWTNLK